jgi:hypothetical protein
MKRFALAYAVALLLSCSPDYQSGSTECSIDGKCPSGFVCGGASSAGALDICYSKDEAKSCDSTHVYYCPASQSCWAEKVACSTVVGCANGAVSACPTDGEVSDCLPSGKCTPGGAGGPDKCPSGDYYCPGSDTCWTSAVACSTIMNCGTSSAHDFQACKNAGFHPDCAGTTCISNSSGSGGGSGGATGGSCPASSGDNACTTCDKQSCCSQHTACKNQTACANLTNCITACASGDTTCFSGCETSYPSGDSNLIAWSNCLTSSCSASCN